MPETLPPKPDVVPVRACDCSAATLLALGTEGYRYDAAGISGLLYFVRDGALAVSPPPPAPKGATYDD